MEMKHHNQNQQQPPSHLWNPSHAEHNKPCPLPRNWKPITNMPGNTTTTTTTTVQSHQLPKRPTRTQRQLPPRNHPSPAIAAIPLQPNPPKNAKAVVAKDDENWSNPLVPRLSAMTMTTMIFHARYGLPKSRPCNRNNSPCGIFMRLKIMMPRANSPRDIRIGP